MYKRFLTLLLGFLMAVTFVNNGALAANATTTTLNIVAPTLDVDDIMIAVILGKDNQVISVPANWTKFVESNNGTAQRVTIAWKRAVAGDSGATFAFTKPTDNNTLFCGVISAWRGCVTTGSPIDATAPTISANASSDTISYTSFDPTETTGHVVAVGVYNNDLTTAGTIAGTNPTLTNRWDLETATGSDGSIFGYSGDSDGAATGVRSHSTTSSADDVNIGVLFGLIAAGGPTLLSAIDTLGVISSEAVIQLAQLTPAETLVVVGSDVAGVLAQLDAGDSLGSRLTETDALALLAEATETIRLITTEVLDSLSVRLEPAESLRVVTAEILDALDIRMAPTESLGIPASETIVVASMLDIGDNLVFTLNEALTFASLISATDSFRVVFGEAGEGQEQGGVGVRHVVRLSWPRQHEQWGGPA